MTGWKTHLFPPDPKVELHISGSYRLFYLKNPHFLFPVNLDTCNKAVTQTQPVCSTLECTGPNKQPPTKAELLSASFLPWAYSSLVILHSASERNTTSIQGAKSPSPAWVTVTKRSLLSLTWARLCSLRAAARTPRFTLMMMIMMMNQKHSIHF